MKTIYIDIMEKALSAYTEERIREYIAEVRRDGLTEHGFPRLGANIGILMAHGRRQELKDTFIEIIDLCMVAFANTSLRVSRRITGYSSIAMGATVPTASQPTSFILRWVM